MRRFLLSSAVLVTLAACAKQPENIAAIPVSGNPYGSYSCSQLAAERLQITQQLAGVEAEQRSAANSDAIGVFLIGLPVSSMSGNDKEAAIGVARGRINEIDRVKLARGCR
ncbi:hypothetical protein [Thalassorhabdomicrobium marinisediminis]|uniref:Lipoprotein n=1 Tax=Thalassorhabdomicrobium marinisediminis TaxID=2170577 RepID=A0A2T7FVA4_9RHOB|nr:hypothetical protein [Thalassorhabdomicrobium marinisediminis]PVA06104.1 hypothetical protein DC363_12390 [Thalassorhabdomicrobium marinisediminis]